MSYNYIEVDLQAIEDNFNCVKTLANNQKVYAVVKANAYGLGAAKVSEKLGDVADGFCVANMEEAVELRKLGISKEILILGYVDIKEFDKLLAYDISITVYNYDYCKKLSSIMKKNKREQKIHIKVDTGHGRLGFQVNEKAVDDVEKISKLENLSIVGIFSHFATADDNLEFAREQNEKFKMFLNSLDARNINYGNRHIGNDAAIVNLPYSYDIVRSGICLYGEYPTPSMKDRLEGKLKRVWSWHSKVSNVKYIEKGMSLGYGRKFIADRKMKVATVSIGYADGYKRILSNKADVLIRGKRARICGNICMDQFMVDASNIDVEIGDDVVLVGKSKNEEIRADELAELSYTISYEIMSTISNRVERRYL